MQLHDDNLRQTPVLITWDVDPSPEVSIEKRRHSLKLTLDLCRAFNMPATFFITAGAAQADSNVLAQMIQEGHQVGCHGLTHTDEEEYDRMPESMQRSYLAEATGYLEKATGHPIRVFRSPRLKVSAVTLEVLTELGYVADSSVCSQRADLISSNLINTGWLTAPRLPYHPDPNNIYRRGSQPIWEVPISAIGIPFISAALSSLGLASMKCLFRLLRQESLSTGKPIVYLGHPIEFASNWVQGFTLKELSPSYIRTHGLMIRKMLYFMNSEKWLAATQDLFAFMSSFNDMKFMTVGDYVAKILD